jgi:hypothetical protein
MFINFVIIANTVVLAQDRYGIDPGVLRRLESINLVFFTIFLAEMILKIVGLGFSTYASDKFNLFDSLIVGVSLLDIILTFTV